MDLTIGAKSTKITHVRNFLNDLEVELEDVDRGQILDAIRDDDGGLAHIVDHLGSGELLSEIGADQAKEHFELVDKDA